VDLYTGLETNLGQHDDAIKCLVYSKELGQVVSGSWDKSVKFWDSRTQNYLMGTYNLPAKVYAMDIVENKLVIAMASRHIFIYDIRNMKETIQRRESSLKYMTRTIKCMPNGEGYACSSIEGRVAVEFFDSSESVQAKKYAFKCHRQKLNDVENIFPVNALDFHPVYGTFASGGGDGLVNIWDGVHRKRNKQYSKFATSISSLSFDCQGKQLAIASSYTYEEGEKEHPVDAIFIMPIGDEAKPKVRRQRLFVAEMQRIFQLNKNLRAIPSISLPRISQPVRYSSHSYDSPSYKTELKEAPEPVLESAQELWSKSKGYQPPPQNPDAEEDRVFRHPLYTPPAKYETGVGPLFDPLKYPEYDVKRPSDKQIGIYRPPFWHEFDWEDPKESPIGAYPRDIPYIWTQLRDPHNHWDKQGRREFGELLHDHSNYADWLSIAPEVHWYEPFKLTLTVAAWVVVMGVSISLWDPEKRRPWAFKEYPYDGLRVELGGDPADEEDKWMSGHVYKE
ncbi:hypothetical protein HK098_002912, partial [Nowakowskiella sp. JEL0407]